MSKHQRKNVKARTTEASAKCLRRNGSLSILDVFIQLGFLNSRKFDAWKSGNAPETYLEDLIQCGPEKLAKTAQVFLRWVHDQKLEAFAVTFQRRHAKTGVADLLLTRHQGTEIESLFRTSFRSKDLSPAKQKSVEAKAQRPAELTAYLNVGSETACVDCDRVIRSDEFYVLENSAPYCLSCVDLGHLVFLPSGDATLTRRSKKNSPLSAIVLKFNKRRRRFDRQGILVTPQAIDQAKADCVADADERAIQRVRSSEKRAESDKQLVQDMATRIVRAYPSCSASEASKIAEHTAERGSGRVGRSAAGRELDDDAIRLAVEAWIRHQHTNYDSLLMQGVQRLDARQQIKSAMRKKIQHWRSPRK